MKNPPTIPYKLINRSIRSERGAGDAFKEIPIEQHQKFMDLVEAAKKESDNGDGTRTGAIIVNPRNLKILGSGSNSLPGGIEMTKELKALVDDRSTKFYQDALQHAERNAIIKCVKERGHGTLNGAAIYASHTPCSQCAWEIVEYGIKFVVDAALPNFNDDYWGKSWLNSLLLFELSGVKYFNFPKGSDEKKQELWNMQMNRFDLSIDERISAFAQFGEAKNFSADLLRKSFMKLKCK